MKIVLVTRGYPQNHNKMLGLFEKDQALALKAVGHDVAYAVVDIRSFRRKRKFGFNHFFDENGLEVFEMNLPLGPMPRPLIEYFRQQALINLYPHILKLFGRPDIIHAHFLNYGVISVKLCQQEKLPLVITEHSSFMNKDNLSPSIYRRAKKAYSACDAIIAVSSALARHIKNTMGYSTYVIHNIAVVNASMQRKIEKNSNKEFIFVSAGRLVEEKGFDVLLKSFGRVHQNYPKTKLIIYGDGPLRKKLKKLARKLGIENTVIFYGVYKKQELFNLYCNADAFVLASKGETFGVVYIEAMGMGIPVIATRCGGPEDFVTEKNGFLVEPNDISGLTIAMKNMIEDRKKFNDEYLKDYVRNSFAPEVIATEVTQVYEQVCAKRRIEQ